MIRYKFITVIATVCACFVASSLNAATIPAGTTFNVSTASSISSQDPVGRTFAAQIVHWLLITPSLGVYVSVCCVEIIFAHLSKDDLSSSSQRTN